MLLWVPPGLASRRLFAVYNTDGSIADPSIAYPFRRETVSIEISAIVSLFAPIIIYVIMFLRVRSFWDLNNAVLTVFTSPCHSLITAV